MLGEDGKGFDIMMSAVLPMFNVLNAACSIGLMESAVQRTAQHASGVRYAHLGSALADLPTIRNYILVPSTIRRYDAPAGRCPMSLRSTFGCIRS